VAASTRSTSPKTDHFARPCAPSCARTRTSHGREVRDIETRRDRVKAAPDRPPGAVDPCTPTDAPQSLTRLPTMPRPPTTSPRRSADHGAAPWRAQALPALQRPDDVRRRRCSEGFTEDDIGQRPDGLQPVGCRSAPEGYKGSHGIFQVMSVSEDIGR